MRLGSHRRAAVARRRALSLLAPVTATAAGNLPSMRISMEALRCPADGSELRADGRELRCDGEGHRYPVIEGVPVLIDDRSSLFSVEEVASSATVPHRRGLLERLAYRIRPMPADNPFAPARLERFRDLLLAPTAGASPRVLVVGGGALGAGMDVLAAEPRLEIVDTDVYLGDRVAVACDAHQLPFADGSFDGVVVQAVLEHVLSPATVVAEIHRVLRDGGLVYAETPFMQAVHEGAFDFTRFTDLGHRRLFGRFEEIDRGVAVGPGSSLLWALRYFARSLPSRGGVMVRLLDFAVSCSFFWLIYVDRRLVEHPGAYDAASGVWFMGRRTQETIDDRRLIAQYRGVAAGKATGDRGFPTES